MNDQFRKHVMLLYDRLIRVLQWSLMLLQEDTLLLRQFNNKVMASHVYVLFNFCTID
jgi:hypothetical protein